MVCDSINDLVERRNGFRVLSDKKGPYWVDWVSMEGRVCSAKHMEGKGMGGGENGKESGTKDMDGRQLKLIGEQLHHS